MTTAFQIFLVVQIIALLVSLCCIFMDVMPDPVWKWRFVDRERLKAQFQFEPRDAWFGLFWRRTGIALHLYICIVPLVPLHVTIATF